VWLIYLHNQNFKMHLCKLFKNPWPTQQDKAGVVLTKTPPALVFEYEALDSMTKG